MMKMSKTSLRRLSRLLQCTGSNLKCITPRLVYASLMANARRKETPIHWSIARYLQQHGISMLLYLVAMLLGYDAAVELKLFAGIYILLLSGICCVSLFFFLFFC